MDWNACELKLSRRFQVLCEKIKCALWIGKDVTGCFHDKFEVIFALDRMMEDDVMTKYQVLCGLEQILK
jgi:hypothetical protein